MRAGVIGIGYIGSIHARNLKKLGVDLFLYDIDQERAKRLAQELGENFVKDFHDFPRVDFYVIVTPAWTHSFYIFSLLSQDVPIFVEKPLATSPIDFQNIIETKSR
jgi:predicted dehydrogenase